MRTTARDAKDERDALILFKNDPRCVPESSAPRASATHSRRIGRRGVFSRIRVNPGVMRRLRSQALNIARANGVKNIAQACWTGALDPAVILSYRGL